MKSFLIAILTSLFFTSCAKEHLEGNGNIVTETRTLPSFSGVSTSGSKHINILYGDEYKVELRGSSNLLSVYQTKIEGKTLELGFENRVRITHDDIQVWVTLPRLNKVILSGSGKVKICGNFPRLENFEAFVSGSGDIELNDDVQADNVRINLSGSAKADLDKLECDYADANVSGSGDIHIGVQKHLNAHISGSGKIYLWGNARVDSRISGSGKVIR